MDVLAQAGVRLGVSYPHRIVSDLPAARRVTVRALLATRAAALDFNDPGGYDLVTVDGTRTRVFTKQEFRLDANGQPKGDGGGDGGAAAAGARAGGRGRGSRRGGGLLAGQGAPRGRGEGRRRPSEESINTSSPRQVWSKFWTKGTATSGGARRVLLCGVGRQRGFCVRF